MTTISNSPPTSLSVDEERLAQDLKALEGLPPDSAIWPLLAKHLSAHPGFKVLKQLTPTLTPRSSKEQALQKEPQVLRGIVLDTETTGMNHLSDKVIELGMIKFEYDSSTGQVLNVIDVFDELEDPGFPIPPETIAVHHITDEMVKGKRMDDQRVNSMLQDVDLVIAHNASFDRPFVENRWPHFCSKRWACSIKDIDWRQNGIGSAKLEYLAMVQGIFYEAHRAEIDCWALLEVLKMVLPSSQQTAIQTLFESANSDQFKVYALGSPFETKDILKQRAYRWSPDIKCWSKVVGSSERLNDELIWLKQHVYGSRKGAKVEIETFSAFERHAERDGLKSFKDLSDLSL